MFFLNKLFKLCESYIALFEKKSMRWEKSVLALMINWDINFWWPTGEN